MESGCNLDKILETESVQSKTPFWGEGIAWGGLQTQGMKTAVVEGHDIGGTCVNRGCVPSKALLAASGRVRELQNAMHLKALGIQVISPHSFRIAYL